MDAHPRLPLMINKYIKQLKNLFHFHQHNSRACEKEALNHQNFPCASMEKKLIINYNGYFNNFKIYFKIYWFTRIKTIFHDKK